MRKQPVRRFLAFFILLLQFLGPFLHAHAHGQAGQEGLHVHIQSDIGGDSDPGLKSDSGTDHWVEAMPQGNTPDPGPGVPDVGDPQQLPPLVYLAALIPADAAGHVRPLPQAPPGGAAPEYTFPPTLAPPSA